MTSRDASDTRPGPGRRRTWWQFGHWYLIFTACFVVAVIALLVVRLTFARGTGLDLAVPLLQLVLATSFIPPGPDADRGFSRRAHRGDARHQDDPVVLRPVGVAGRRGPLDDRRGRPAHRRLRGPAPGRAAGVRARGGGAPGPSGRSTAGSDAPGGGISRAAAARHTGPGPPASG